MDTAPPATFAGIYVIITINRPLPHALFPCKSGNFAARGECRLCAKRPGCP